MTFEPFARRSAPIRALAVTLTLGLPASAFAQAACVDPSVEASVTRCEGVDVVAVSRRRAPPAALPAAEAPAATDATTAPGFELDPGVELRTPDHARRERRLLEREVQVLERILRRTDARDPRHGDVLERLAMTHDELRQQATVRARALDAPIHEARGGAPVLGRLTRQQREAEESARQHREAAIRTLAQLVADHTDRRGLDGSLFTLALHLGAIGQHTRARQVYHRLLRAFPESRFVPHAYLAFAEHYFAEGELDPARQFYERVLAIPPERNSVFGYARYKLAWVRFNQDDFRGALDEFVRLLEHTRQHPDARDAATLARQARRELVMPYARVGRPAQALAFFRRVAADDEEAFVMLEALASLYHDTGQWPESVALHHQLMAERQADASLCRWQHRVLDATIASRPKAAQREEAERLAALGETPCQEETATALLLLATAWHREAIGTDDQPGTRDAGTMRHAAALYGVLLDAFPRLDALELPRLDRRDRPSRARVSFFRADLLFEQQRWSECATSFEATLDAEPDPQLAADAAYGAVLCYDRHLGSREPPRAPADEALSARPLTDDEERMGRTFRRFACAAPEHPERPIVLYRWARLFYEANRFEEASALFSRIALEHPDSEVGPYAANLWLDSLGVLAERRGRVACFDAMRAAIPRIEASYCPQQAEVCEALTPLTCRLGAEEARAMGEAGRHREAAEGFVALARRTPRCEEAPRYLYNAAIHYESARLLGRAIRVRVTLVNAFADRPELAVRAVHQVGANYHALAIYGQAADWYERYAREHATCAPLEGEACPDPAEGLQDAVLFRMGLGETERALEDAALFERLYGRRRPALAAQVVFAIGAVFAEEPERQAAHYRDFVRRYARHATPTQLARAHVMQARGWLAQERRDRAEPGWRAAIQIHARGADAAIDALPLPPEERELQRALLRDAASEALYQLAEGRRLAFEALRFPRFRGAASLARVERWSQRELAPWLERKRALLAEAEEAYGQVAPLAIPRWQIAAASRLGDMRVRLARQILESPIPDVILRDDELLADYETRLIEVARPIELAAIDRYEFCMVTATRARWFDGRSRRCEEALNALDAARFPIASELRGEPDYQTETPAPPAAVLRDG